MKIDIKNKKTLGIIVGTVVGAVVLINVLYTPINVAQNDFVEIECTPYNIERAIMDNKNVLLNLQDKMMKLNENKEKSIQIDKMISDLDHLNLKDENKRKENLEHLDLLNEEIDKMIEMYNENENMKKDVEISNNIVELESLNAFVDEMMENHNMYVTKFKKVVAKFPVSLVAEKKGWTKVYNFSSVE